MIADISIEGRHIRVDLSKPIDISLPVMKGGVKAWYVQDPEFESVRMGDWIGEVAQGGSVNFRNITFNPHGHGTHTECVGHISREIHSVNRSLKKFFFLSELITLVPEQKNSDHVITKKTLEEKLKGSAPEALLLRTLTDKINPPYKDFSNTNPPYLEKECMEMLVQKGISHLLLDMPSVDKEVDDGKLEAHSAFWEYPHNTNFFRTITEMIFVPMEIPDGCYLLELQVAPFENDAAPSRPVLYKLI